MYYMTIRQHILYLSFGLLLSGCAQRNQTVVPTFDWGKGVIAPDLTWAQKVGARQCPEGKIFKAADYGLPTDTAVLSTQALQKAIDACNEAGGGTVVLDPGVYRTGALFVKTGVQLSIGRGVTLIASDDINDYPEFRSRIAGIEMEWPAAVINIMNAERASISGEGVIDCRGKVFWDNYWAMRREYEKRGLRWIVDYDCKRVRGLLVSNSRDITLSGFTLMRTGFWACQVLYSDHCTLTGITINNNIGGHGPSTDGIDIDSSTNILIEHCDIDCNDDNICIKAGRDADGLRVNRPTENIVIRHCTTRKGAGLITCGSETSGSIRNILGYQLKAFGTSAALRLKSAMNRGGTVENIYMTQIEVDSVGNVLAADLNWNPSYSYSRLPAEFEGKEIPEHWKVMLTPVEPKEKGYPHFRNIYLSQVKATHVKRFISASGWNDSLRLENFYLHDIEAAVKEAGTVRFAEAFHLNNIRLKVADGSRVQEYNNKNSQLNIRYE